MGLLSGVTVVIGHCRVFLDSGDTGDWDATMLIASMARQVNVGCRGAGLDMSKAWVVPSPAALKLFLFLPCLGGCL